MCSAPQNDNPRDTTKFQGSIRSTQGRYATEPEGYRGANINLLSNIGSDEEDSSNKEIV